MAKLGSIEAMLALDDKMIESLSREQLAPIVTRMNDVSNRRIKRIEKETGLYSPAANYIKRTGGFEGVRGKSLEDIRNLYYRAKRFLQSSTSTVKGTRQYKKETFERVAKSVGMTAAELEGSLSNAQMKKFWKVIDRAAESGIISKSGKEFYRVREILSKEISEGDKRRGVEKLFEKLFDAENGLYYKAIETTSDETPNLLSSYYD